MTVPFEEWESRSIKISGMYLKDKKAWMKEHEKLDKLRLYPSCFFPKECAKGKWKFKITVEATPL